MPEQYETMMKAAPKHGDPMHGYLALPKTEAKKVMVENIRECEASSVNYRLLPDEGRALLHFTESDKPPLVVSVSLSELKRLYWIIGADIRKWPELSLEKGCYEDSLPRQLRC
jgi:hypothetical protein